MLVLYDKKIRNKNFYICGRRPVRYFAHVSTVRPPSYTPTPTRPPRHHCPRHHPPCCPHRLHPPHLPPYCPRPQTTSTTPCPRLRPPPCRHLRPRCRSRPRPPTTPRRPPPPRPMPPTATCFPPVLL